MASRLLQKVGLTQHTKCCKLTANVSKLTNSSRLVQHGLFGIQNAHIRNFSHVMSVSVNTSIHYQDNVQTHVLSPSKFRTFSPAKSASCQQKSTAASKFKVLEGDVDTSADTFKSSYEHCKELEERFEQLVGYVRLGGGERGMKTHVERNKKVFVRDRLRMLLDDYDNEFLEIGSLAGMGMEYGDIPAAAGVSGKFQYHKYFITFLQLVAVSQMYSYYS